MLAFPLGTSSDARELMQPRGMVIFPYSTNSGWELPGWVWKGDHASGRDQLTTVGQRF